MQVVKRNGRREDISLDKVTKRVAGLCTDLTELDPVVVAQKAVQGLYDGISTEQIDTLASEVAASLITKHHAYGLLAGRIATSSLHKRTKNNFSGKIRELVEDNPNRFNSDFVAAVKQIGKQLDAVIDYKKDFDVDYFAFTTLKNAYLMRNLKGEVVERLQDMYMRVAVALHLTDVEKVIESYKAFSDKLYTHATPTLYNAGTARQQLSSCFLTPVKEDSIDGIFGTLLDCAKISQHAGGIGVSFQNVRSKGAKIKGIAGESSGIMPFLRTYNNTARAVNQGGKRKGSFAMYLEPWHADIIEFLDLKKNHGKEELRARDLFYALWIPDLFMKRVQEGGIWSLFNPDDAIGLIDSYGEEFEKLYLQYEQEGKYVRQMPAQELMTYIAAVQIETGMPYMLYKEACNKKSNQKILGTIRSSNLCAEIIEYSSKDEIAVCNLASISLPSFVQTNEGKVVFNYEKLGEITRMAVRNLDRVIDINYYPLDACRDSNFKHRPMGIGIQGLADVFLMFNIPFDSKEAREINRKIHATMYYYAVLESAELAEEKGSYSSFEGSPMSKGEFQFDLWKEDMLKWDSEPDGMYDWKELREIVKKKGQRHSLLLTLMPTASTSQILGNNECFEPYTSNIYVRRTLSGEFIVVNKYLMQRLASLGLWNDKVRNEIIKADGSVQGLSGLPAYDKEVFKTVWEISNRSLIEMSADRGPYICQSQSLNLFMKEPTVSKVASMHMFAWKMGLKTGMYYLRSSAAAKAIQFTLDKETLAKEEEKLACSIDNPEDCEMCGS